MYFLIPILLVTVTLIGYAYKRHKDDELLIEFFDEIKRESFVASDEATDKYWEAEWYDIEPEDTKKAEIENDYKIQLDHERLSSKFENERKWVANALITHAAFRSFLKRTMEKGLLDDIDQPAILAFEFSDKKKIEAANRIKEKITQLRLDDAVPVNKRIGNVETNLMDNLPISTVVLEFVPDELRSNRDFVLKAVQHNCWNLKYTSDILQSDKEIVLAAVKQNGWMLKYASPELQNNVKVVNVAVKNCTKAWSYASVELRKNKSVILGAVVENGEVLKYAAHKLQDDEDVVIAAVKTDGTALRFASERLQADKEVVLVAVQNDGEALQYAAEDIKSNKEIVLQAVRTKTRLWKWLSNPASEIAFDHRWESEREERCVLKHASTELRSKRKIVLEAVKQIGWSLKYASSDLQNDREVVLHAVQQDGKALRFASDFLREDEEIKLISSTKGVFRYLFFDTETTGLPRNWNASASETKNWPRLVQLGWIQFDSTGAELDRGNHIIKPKGFTIPVESSNVHGKTHEYAMQNGEDLNGVLSEFQRLVSESSVLVAHNMSFDEKVVGAEFYRAKMDNIIADKVRKCTMESSTDYCAIEGPYGYKWPSLSELHIKLFGFDFEGAHDAMADIEATAKCFWELRKRGAL